MENNPIFLEFEKIGYFMYCLLYGSGDVVVKYLKFTECSHPTRNLCCIDMLDNVTSYQFVGQTNLTDLLIQMKQFVHRTS